MMFHYFDFSRQQRRDAKKLAKELLRTVPAAEELSTLHLERPLTNATFFKPKNLLAALVHSEGKDNWRSYVAFKNGTGVSTIRTTPPLQSREEAFELLKGIIATLKTNEHRVLDQNDCIVPTSTTMH
jgi:16S rRNA C967 or C1407 C5-methylase (RsmB/RsmF family)